MVKVAHLLGLCLKPTISWQWPELMPIKRKLWLGQVNLNYFMQSVLVQYLLFWTLVWEDFGGTCCSASTDFGLMVSFEKGSHARVKLPDDYHEKVCCISSLLQKKNCINQIFSGDSNCKISNCDFLYSHHSYHTLSYSILRNISFFPCDCLSL